MTVRISATGRFLFIPNSFTLANMAAWGGQFSSSLELTKSNKGSNNSKFVLKTDPSLKVQPKPGFGFRNYLQGPIFGIGSGFGCSLTCPTHMTIWQCLFLHYQ